MPGESAERAAGGPEVQHHHKVKGERDGETSNPEKAEVWKRRKKKKVVVHRKKVWESLV